jgi:Protein of unknown function (DUF4043)
MALTTNHANNELIKFRSEVIVDFLRPGRFDPYMGENSTYPIVRFADLESNGKQLDVPLATQLSGPGVGAGQLTGNEEQIATYGYPLWADWGRNAVTYTKNTEKEVSYQTRSLARDLLRGWGQRIIRDDIVDSLLSIPTGAVQANRLQAPGNRVNGVTWAAASTAQKNAWTAANVDRVLFGSLVGNYSATFATGALNVDSANDKLTAAVVELMKSIAMQTGVTQSNPGVYNGKPKITPWKAPELDTENYILFCGARAFRDLRADATMFQANRDARERENNPTNTNPIFAGGELIWNGVIIKEIPEITQRLLLTGIGAAGIDVEPCFLCGQAAIAYGMGQMPRPTGLDVTDYDFLRGLGIETQYGIGKVAYATPGTSTLIDFGMVTAFVSGVANA